MRAAAALLVSVVGCAGARPPSPDLLIAQRVLARAYVAPFAPLAREEIAAAEDAIESAEEAHAVDPGSVGCDDDAYVARRAAELSLLAGRCAAAREALFKARRAANHLAADLARRDAFFAELSRRREAQARAHEDLRLANRAAITAALGPGARLLDRPDALVVRFASEDLFIRGTSLLKSGAELHLDALCRGLASAPSYAIGIDVLDDVEGVRSAPALLAARRRARIADTLRGCGVPDEVIVPSAARPPPGAQIDVLVITPEPPLPE